MDPEDRSKSSIEVLKSLILSKESSCSEKATYYKCLSSYIKENNVYRLHCDRYGIYSISIIFLYTSQIEKILKIAILEFLMDFLDGFPELVEITGIYYFISIADNEDDDFKIYGLKLICIICTGNKTNQKLCIDFCVYAKLAYLITCAQQNNEVLFSALKVLSTLNWEMSLFESNYFSKALRSIDDLLKSICNMIRVHNNPELHFFLLEALISIVVNYSYISEAINAGGLNGVLNVFDKISTLQPGTLRENLACQCITFFSMVVCNEDAKRKMMNYFFVDKIYNFLIEFNNVREHIVFALLLIGNIALNRPDYGKVFFEWNFPPLIVDLMKKFSADEYVLHAGCWCVENMSSGNTEYHQKFLNLGVEKFLNDLSRTKGTCSFWAKRALLQLGCRLSVQKSRPKKKNLEHFSLL